MFGHKPAANLDPDPYAAARQHMLESQLRPRGIVLRSVLEAMAAIPRHLFVPHEFAGHAYADRALPSLEGQTISQPFIVAIMSQELAIHPGMRILEIGTGTGYQTAILAHLTGPAGTVSTIERVPALANFAHHRLAALGFHNIHLHTGDGSAGWPDPAPQFDRILITAGTPSIPAPLLTQLANPGILIAPVGNTDSQILTRITRTGDRFDEKHLLNCRFVPLVGAHAWNRH